jgi:hypothetical protein
MGSYQKSDVEFWLFKPKKNLNLVTRNSKSTDYVTSLGKQRNPENNLCSEFYPFQHPGLWTLSFSFVVMISLCQFPISYSFSSYIKVIRKVRKRRHRNPCLGRHIGDEISKNRKNKYTGLQRGIKLSAKLSLPGPCFSWTPSTNHCCCFVYCSYKCSRASCV